MSFQTEQCVHFIFYSLKFFFTYLNVSEIMILGVERPSIVLEQLDLIFIIIIILSFPPHFVPPTKTFVSRHIEKIFHHMYRSYLTGLISPFRKLIFFPLRSYLPKHRKHCYH